MDLITPNPRERTTSLTAPDALSSSMFSIGDLVKDTVSRDGSKVGTEAAIYCHGERPPLLQKKIMHWSDQLIGQWLFSMVSSRTTPSGEIIEKSKSLSFGRHPEYVRVPAALE
jgi:hypothetical protein